MSDDAHVVHANVHEAMAAAMAETGYVQKTGRITEGGKYTFAGETDILAALRPVMVRHGLFIYPSRVVGLRLETYSTKSGATMNHVIVEQEYRMAHESATELTIQVAGAGADVGDKAVPKANTGAFKYALRQSFAIETGDDPDEDGSDTQERDRREQQQSEDLPPLLARNAFEQAMRDGAVTLGSIERELGFKAENATDARAWWIGQAYGEIEQRLKREHDPEGWVKGIIAKAAGEKAPA